MTESIPARLFRAAEIHPERPAYFAKRGGAWRSTSYAQYADEVKQAARALVSLGFQPGQRICILGFNRPEWTILDLATMAAGGAPAGIYTTCSADEVQYILEHSEAPLVLVEDEGQLRKVEARRSKLPALKHIVAMRGARIDGATGVLSWEDFLARGDATNVKEITERVAAIAPSGLATLIYTSGTTGPPKAVMLSHENLTWTADCLQRVAFAEAPPEGMRTLSYLPLSHIAEQMVSIHCAVTLGNTIYFAESIDKIADNLKDCRPHLFFGVPRIWEKFHAAIGTKLAAATGAKAQIAKWARGVGTQASAGRAKGQDPSGLLGLQYKLATRAVFAPTKQAIGLDQAVVLVSGAAPIAKEVIEFFASLDLFVQEIYGQSEDCGPTSFNLARRTKFGSVGIPLPGVDVRIAEDGEIMVRGKNVFLGYFKDEEATKATLTSDGWLHTGDLGKVDDDGFLWITGRKKEIIITAGGKNITPKNIEEAVKTASPVIAECVVIGDRRKFLSMLVWLEPDAAKRFLEGKGAPVRDALHESPELRAEVQRAIDVANESLARVEQIKKLTLCGRALSIDTGELTPTLKVKRNKVVASFAKEIDAMYEGD
ncbi:MAG: long-chain fatty acid--CoA ligase [Deltaproteobacteria bacterium]|nr:long-chain fatty acid--CoA ligase [Deltaproteobacteria bacterium]